MELKRLSDNPPSGLYVILSEAKNLMASGTYNSEILRLKPQNDVVGQPPKGDCGIKRFWIEDCRFEIGEVKVSGVREEK